MKNISKMMIVMAGLTLAACGKNEETAEMVVPEGANVIQENLPIEEPQNMGAAKTKLPVFTAKDQKGDPYTIADIEKNDATVINLWFTGCSACIEEMDELNTLADELHKEDGVEFISMCTDVNYDQSTKEAYERIIADKKPTYKALAVDYEGDMKDYLETIFAYPTTIVVDKNGKIIGDPIEGALIPQEQKDKLNENIKMAIESSKNS